MGIEFRKGKGKKKERKEKGKLSRSRVSCEKRNGKKNRFIFIFLACFLILKSKVFIDSFRRRWHHQKYQLNSERRAWERRIFRTDKRNSDPLRSHMYATQLNFLLLASFPSSSPQPLLGGGWVICSGEKGERKIGFQNANTADWRGGGGEQKIRSKLFCPSLP